LSDRLLDLRTNSIESKSSANPRFVASEASCFGVAVRKKETKKVVFGSLAIVVLDDKADEREVKRRSDGKDKGGVEVPIE
jgi:hypothetical protein